MSFIAICPIAMQQIEKKAIVGPNVYGGSPQATSAFLSAFQGDVHSFPRYTDSPLDPSVLDNTLHSFTDVTVIIGSSCCYVSEGVLGLPKWAHNRAVADSCSDWPV